MDNYDTHTHIFCLYKILLPLTRMIWKCRSQPDSLEEWLTFFYKLQTTNFKCDRKLKYFSIAEADSLKPNLKELVIHFGLAYV